MLEIQAGAAGDAALFKNSSSTPTIPSDIRRINAAKRHADQRALRPELRSSKESNASQKNNTTLVQGKIKNDD